MHLIQLYVWEHNEEMKNKKMKKETGQETWIMLLLYTNSATNKYFCSLNSKTSQSPNVPVKSLHFCNARYLMP